MVPSSTRTPLRGTYRRMTLPVAVWAFLLALLFGAVAPLGPPETLVHGAAFNPATTSVAIAAKRSDAGLAVWHSVRGARQDGASGGSAVLSPALALASVVVLGAFLHVFPPAKILRPVRCGARGARAPPGGR